MRHRSLWFLWPVLAALTAPVAADEQRRTISITGEGKATASPDMAVIQTGVTTEAPAAEKALAANTKAMEQVLAVLKQHGVAAKHVQTSAFEVSPVYKRDDEPRAAPEVVGYRVTNQVRVEVHQLPGLGKVLDALVRAGSNQVSGIRFGLADSTGVLDEARNRAFADARRRAQLYAQAAGVRLGKVLTISEQSAARPLREAVYFGRSLAAQDAAAVPVAAGEEELRATVHVVFALEDER